MKSNDHLDFEHLMAMASDERCSNIMAATLVMASVATDTNGWRAIERDVWFSALPDFGPEEYLDTVSRAMLDDEKFSAAEFFVELQLLPSPVHAAVCMAMFVADLGRDGMDGMLGYLHQAFRDKAGELNQDWKLRHG
jgi:hypothetical protein